jgi:fused signal recognition particle receptor
MPPFNWFDRGNKKPEQAQPQSPPQEQETDDSDPSSPSTEAQTQAEDYLNWAKAAYQNIQKTKQQGESALSDTADSGRAEPAPSEEKSGDSAASSVAAKPSTTAPEAPPVAVSSDTSKAAESSTIDASSEESAATLEAASPIAPSTEAVGLSTDTDAPILSESTELASESTPQPDTEPTPSPQASLPFWAKAETERQERLERLKAEAIEEPEPEPVSESSAAEPSADVDFDENFIWSAGVLAAQGRRPDEISAQEITWLKQLRQGLGKTRRGLINQLRSIVGQGPLNQDAVMEIEALLLQADVGIEATDYVIDALQDRMKQETLPPEEAIAYLKEIIRAMLDQPFKENYEQDFTPQKDVLNIWLMTGVNGAGKTTTIGKLAHMARESDYTCLIAAADTFRAAAVEQVKIWGQRSNVEVIANPGKNTDPAAVVFDAISAAQARHTDLLLVDTAGRLQNKKNLMAELNKIRKILDKKAPEANIESLLVLDATLGQNGLRQAEVFAEAAQLSGVVLTKLDGTAKGGVALAVVKQLGLPIRFIGAGEGIEDLRPFSSYEFVEALLSG